MIFEFALEPEFVIALAKSERLDFLNERLGMKEGRLIADFPKEDWCGRTWKLVLEETTLDEIDRKSLEEALVSLDKRRVLLPRSSEWSEADSWLVNALRADEEDPFQAILATTCPDGCDRVVQSPVEAGRTHPLLKVTEERRIERSADRMAQRVEPMLRLASRIYLIDPWWDPRNERFAETFRAFVSAALRKRKRAVPSLIEVHRRLSYNEETGPTRAAALLAWEDMKRKWREEFPGILPRGTTARLVLHECPRRLFHDRYVLTEFGGVQFSAGTDEEEHGEEGTRSKTHVHRIDEAAYSDIWHEYLGTNPVHAQVDKETIEGTREVGR